MYPTGASTSIFLASSSSLMLEPLSAEELQALPGCGSPVSLEELLQGEFLPMSSPQPSSSQNTSISIAVAGSSRQSPMIPSGSSGQKPQTGDKPFVCGVCQQGFTRKCFLVRHQVLHSEDRLFNCAECSKTFKTRDVLTMHQRTHSGEKPFKCRFCGKAFTQKATLTNHERTHTGVKPFSCSSCGLGFIQRATLNQHMKAHTRQALFKCELCGVSYDRQRDLTIHNNRTHKS